VCQLAYLRLTPAFREPVQDIHLVTKGRGKLYTCMASCCNNDLEENRCVTEAGRNDPLTSITDRKSLFTKVIPIVVSLGLL